MRVLRDFAGREGWHLQGRYLASGDALILLFMPPSVSGDKEELEEPERQKAKVKRQK